MIPRSSLYQIESYRDTLSDKEARIADFILADPGRAVNPSLEELAELIGVSDTTLFRFVRKIGFAGYQQFRIALATDTVEGKKTVYETTDEVKDAESAISVVFKANIAALERTMAHLDQDALDRAAHIIAASSRVHFFGIGGSHMVAQDAYHKFLRSGLSCTAADDFHLQLMQAAQAREGDAAFLVSHSGANKDSLALAEVIKEGGASLIVMSSRARSPLVKLADIHLVSEATASPYVSEAFSARIAQLSIVDALYVDVMKLLDERGVDSLERMRSAIAKRRL